MKKYFLFLFSIGCTVHLSAQEFAKQITSAKTSYAAGKLEETHFSLQQALQELDLVVGKEILKMLPTKMDSLNTTVKEDNVTANTSFIGTTIRRVYAAVEKKAELTIISNSPLVASINAVLNMPMVGGMMRDENSKTVKVQGYKARLERSDNGDNTFSYKIDVPFNNSLLTFTLNKSSETEILVMVDKIPLANIAKLIQ